MDKAKKKRLKSYIAWISLAALVVLLAVMPLLARQEAEEEGPVASILEDTVQMTAFIRYFLHKNAPHPRIRPGKPLRRKSGHGEISP